VGDLVRMALGDGLGGEQELVVGKRAHEIWRDSSAVESASPLVELRPIARILLSSGRSARYRALRVSPVCSPRLRSWLKSRKSSEETRSGRFPSVSVEPRLSGSERA